LMIRGAPRGDLAAGHGADKGNISLELARNSEKYAIPVARWWFEQQKLKPAAECGELPVLTDLPQIVVQPGMTKVVVIASGDEVDGAPQMTVTLDHTQIGNVEVTANHKADEWQRFTFTVHSDERPVVLTVALTNDK